MIMIYCHDGELRSIDAKPTLEIVQSLVGGLIEQVPGTRDAWCNEEGMIHYLPVNKAASNRYNQVLYGQVVVAELD